MPVTPDQVAEISRATVDLYRAAEGAILREVTRRLAAGMDAPDWAVTRLGAVSTLRRAVDSILQLVLAKFAEGIRAALARAYRGGQAEATAGVPARFLPRDSDAVRAAGIIAEQLPRAGVIENLAVALVQDVGARHSNVVRHVTDVYRQVIAEATAVSVAGGMTRRQASQHAYQKLVDQGVTSFTDVRGRRWRLSSYVEMGVRTVTQRAAVQGQVDKQQRLGLPFVVVSNEAGECVLCRPFEGRVLRHAAGPTGSVHAVSPSTGKPVTVDVVATLDEARAQGFQHPNCRHSVRAYLPGVTRLPEQPTADPAGDEARQRQRAIERAIRKYKERELGALTPEGKAAARGKVRLWQGQMRDHLAAHPALKRLLYREQIGAGNIPPGHGRRAPASPPAPINGPTKLDPTLDQIDEPDRDPLDGIDLERLPAGDLFALWDEHADDLDVYDRIGAELDRRDQALDLVDDQAGPDQEPVSDGDQTLAELDEDADRAALLEATAADKAARELEVDRLVDGGMSYMDANAQVYADVADEPSDDEMRLEERQAAIDADRRPGESREQAVRRAYEEWVYLRYMEAETATRGHLLTHEAEAKEIDPVSLFSGPAQVARKYASEELKVWWAENDGRKTYTEFRAEILGRASDIRAAERLAGPANDRDFGL